MTSRAWKKCFTILLLFLALHHVVEAQCVDVQDSRVESESIKSPMPGKPTAVYVEPKKLGEGNRR